MGDIKAALAALESLEPGARLNYTKVAIEFGVDRSTLSRRHRGIQQPRSTQYESQRILNNQQSEQLITWVNGLTERGLPPSNEMIRNFAKEIVGTKPGKNWPSRWLKAHSDKVISYYTTGMDASRKKADSAFKYSLYFELLARKIEQYKLEPEYMYNMDEKGFLIGVLVKAKRIFSKLRYEQGGLRQQIQDGNREWITTIGCICADGTSLSPGLIYQATSGQIQDSWLQDFDPEEQKCFFASSSSGWTNDELGYAWLTTIFDRETKEKARRKWRLLILDGHGSHVTMRFINFCDTNKILLALYPPHSTHTLQPLDVSLFGPLAKAYSLELEQFLHDSQGFSRLTKRDFFRLFWASWQKTFTAKNIQSGWRSTGLHPWDPERILVRFTRPEEERPSSSESSMSILKAEDWRRIEKLLKQVVSDIHDKKTRQLNDTMMALSTENILLKLRCKGLETALVNEKKRRQRGKPLLLDQDALQDGGAIFYSPNKVQRARDLQTEKEQTAQLARIAKEEDKARRQREKEEKRRLVEERKRIRSINREARLREQEEKRRRKEDRIAAKQLRQQAQNETEQIPKNKASPSEPILIEESDRDDEVDGEEVGGVLPRTNHWGRQLRLPQRYRNNAK
jgi:hypothetical protein